MNKRMIFLIFPALVILASCEGPTDPGGNGNECDDGPPCLPPVPTQVGIMAPTSAETYWTDKAIPCKHNQPDYADKTTWLVDGEVVSCAGGELDAELAEGEHDVTVRTAEGDEAVEKSITITVKEGFSVFLDKPKSGAEFFVGDKVSCTASIEPEKYAEHLQITIDGGGDCTDGQAELHKAGETAVRASATINGRTEAEVAEVLVKPAVAGKIYPLTDQGVASQGAGFTVTLEAGGDVIDTGTTSDGSFAIKSDIVSELGSQQVTLSVSGRSGEFYGAKAILPADGLLKLVEEDRLGFILAPRSWTIRDGKLSGRSTDLKLRAAFTRYDSNDHNSSFYKLQKVFGRYKYISVFSENLPLPKAFNRVESEVKVAANDSTDFWRQTDNVTEAYIGRGDIFAPATIAEVPSIEDGFRVQALKSGERSSASGIADYNDGYIVGGWMDLEIDEFGSYVQTHEQGHNLGFGHTRMWDGIMTAGTFDSPGQGTTKPTVDDVSHIQVYMDAFDLQFEQSISFGVLEWMQALDIEGLPETNSSQTKTTGKRFASYHHETIECQIH